MSTEQSPVRELVCPSVPWGQRESPSFPAAHRHQRGGEKEKDTLQKDRLTLRTLFRPLQVIPIWTWNRLFKWRGDCSTQKRLECCLLSCLDFTGYPEGWALWGAKQFFLISLYSVLFMVMLGLHCCMRATLLLQRIYIGKDWDAGKDWEQKRVEDEMVK